MTSLTPKQQRFVEEYLVDMSATAACVRAGYSAKTANSAGPRLLVNVGVAAAIEVAIAKRSERTEVTQDWVVQKFVENVERAMQAVPVLDHEGEPTGEYTYQGSVVNGALTQLGKHTGGFADEHKHGVVPGQGRVTFIMELESDD